MARSQNIFHSPMTLFAGVAFLSLSACAVDSTIVPDESAKARLDYENTRVYLPLTEYDLSPEQYFVVTRAAETAIARCMAPKGFSIEVATTFRPQEDRTFGLWNVENARKYGFGSKGDDPSQQGYQVFQEGELPFDPSNEPLLACEAELAPLLETITPISLRDATQSTALSQAGTEAGVATMQDPRWQTHRDGWRQCLRDNGLEPDESENTTGSKQRIRPGRDTAKPPTSEDLESDIRIATIEATCDQQTQKTQRLSDLMAAYQMPVLHKYQAALTAEKELNAEYVRRAEEYLASHG